MYILPTYQKILDTVTSQIVSYTGVDLLRNSVLRVLATVIAKAIYYTNGYASYIAQQGVPFTATDVTLEAWGSLKSITRKTATLATSNVTFTGSDTTAIIPAGTVLSRADGFQYTTDTATNIGEPVNITATSAGTSGNTQGNISLTLANTISGVASSVVLTNPITNGTDMESDDELRTRIITEFQKKGSGGTVADHVSWALSAPGVSQAWCLPSPEVSGEVIVYVMMDRTNTYQGYPQGTDGTATQETRYLSATGDQLSVANSMYANKPVGEIMIVCSPVKQTVDFKIDGLSNLTSTQQSEIQSALSDVFHTNCTPLGTTIYLTAITSAISTVAGTNNFTLKSPSQNITTTQGILCEVGNITYNS